jgi:hypothetical protein
MVWSKVIFGAFTVLVFWTSLQLNAQEATKQLMVQLNKVQAVDGACRITFVMTNQMGVEIKAASLEIVLFDKEQTVLDLLAVNPGRLPSGKTRVKQFDLKGVACSGIGRVLLNDIKRCDGEGLRPQNCLDAARLSTRIDIPFGN